VDAALWGRWVSGLRVFVVFYLTSVGGVSIYRWWVCVAEGYFASRLPLWPRPGRS
jgi:hypothetical protein